jgi:hypothetical protein
VARLMAELSRDRSVHVDGAGNETVPAHQTTTDMMTALGRRSAVIRPGELLVRFIGIEAHAIVVSCASTNLSRPRFLCCLV